MKLYYSPGSCALAPHIVMEWMDINYELEKVTLGDPDFLKLNPLGAVPVLIDGDHAPMNQADAILKYLANKYLTANLGDDGSSLGKYELDKWLAFFTGDFHPAFYPYFVPQRYTISEDEKSMHATKQASLALIKKFLNHIENHLVNKTYFVNDRLSIVDAYAFPMIRWANSILDQLVLYPNTKRFFDSLIVDNGVKAAMQKQGLKTT